MSKESAGQKKAFRFLLANFTKRKTFSKDKFRTATGWGPSTFNTYWPKQFKTLLIPLDGQIYRVGEVFRRFSSWNKFRNHVTQNRRVAVDYTPMTFERVMLFDFFMPLTNEGYLRTSLDALFYKDSIITRLKSVDITELKVRFKSRGQESDAQFYKRLCKWISGKFGGYSISHVNGRFRADELKFIQEASDILAKSGRYLVDETTAVVRFIFPCGGSTKGAFHSGNQTEPAILSVVKKANDEAERIRYFFYLLFVQSIVEVVNGEDEIWLLESGLKNRLHIWRVQSD